MSKIPKFYGAIQIQSKIIAIWSHLACAIISKKASMKYLSVV